MKGVMSRRDFDPAPAAAHRGDGRGGRGPLPAGVPRLPGAAALPPGAPEAFPEARPGDRRWHGPPAPEALRPRLSPRPDAGPAGHRLRESDPRGAPRGEAAAVGRVPEL